MFHKFLTPYDIWADYARHYNEGKGKKQTEIARILGVKQPIVSYRLKLFNFAEQYPEIREFTCQEQLTEEHLRIISTLHVDMYFSKWLIAKDLWFEIAKQARNMTTRETKEEIAQVKGVKG